jgi:predicted DNA-binding transcriptional regulator AlpA
MSEKVSSFLSVKKGEQEYLFFLVNESGYSTKIQDVLEANVEPFGKDLDIQGKIVRAYDTKGSETYGQVKSKPWTSEVAARIDGELDPFLLIIENDFAAFDPRTHRWSILWFSSFAQEPESLPRMLHKLVKLAAANKDLFEYVNSLESKPEEVELLASDKPVAASTGEHQPEVEKEAVLGSEIEVTSSTAAQDRTIEAPAVVEPPQEDDHQLINSKDVAEMVSMSYSYVRGQKSQRDLGEPHDFDVEPVMVGTSVRYVLSEVKEWIKKRKKIRKNSN